MTIETATIAIKVAIKQPGHTLLAIAPLREQFANTGQFVVVMQRDDYEPFVCWRVDEQGNCEFGIYRTTLERAMIAFVERLRNWVACEPQNDV